LQAEFVEDGGVGVVFAAVRDDRRHVAVLVLLLMRVDEVALQEK
jgi:hypothetical protein